MKCIKIFILFSNDGVSNDTYPMACADEDSPDIAYIRKVFTFLESQPEYFDMTRVYAEGFSQNSVFSAYIGYCFADNVRGIYQGKLYKCYYPSCKRH